MTALGIFLAVIGAILYFALDVEVAGVDLDMVGIILMAAGALAFLVGVFRWFGRDRSSTIRTKRQQSPDGSTVIEETETD